MMKQLQALESTLAHLDTYSFKSNSFRSRIDPSLKKTSKLIQCLRAKFTKLAELWTDTAIYFGEDLEEYNHFILPKTQADYQPSKKMPTILFMFLDQFFQSFEEAHQQNIIKKNAQIKKKATEQKKIANQVLQANISMKAKTDDDRKGIANLVTGTLEDFVKSEARKMVHRYSLMINSVPVIEKESKSKLKLSQLKKLELQEEIQEY